MADYPTPLQLGITLPPHIIQSRFDRGFEHALKGGKITEVAQLRLSFREGFRAGHLYLKSLRKAMGIHNFPVQGKVRFTMSQPAIAYRSASGF